MIEIPTELENIMLAEATALVRENYSLHKNKKGFHELNILIKMYKKDHGKKNILAMAKFTKPIKLKRMRRSWEFTRPLPMTIRLFETFVYFLISKIHNFIYFSMILSMYANAGIIGLFYPIVVFGYALLEEVRPK